MPATILPISFLILNFFALLILLIIIVLAARRYRDFSSPAFWLVLFASLSLVLHLGRLGQNLGYTLGLSPDRLVRLEEYGSLALMLLLLQTLWLFVGRKFQVWGFLLAAALCAGLIAFNNRLFVFLASLVCMVLTLILLIQVLSQTRQHLHRNRLLYWVPVIGLAAANQISLYYYQGLYAVDLRFGEALIVAYLVLRHHVPDIQDFVRQFAIYLITTLAGMALYIAGYAIVERLMPFFPGLEPLLAGAAVAVVVSLLFMPLFRLVRKLVNRIYRLQNYDPSLTLRNYSSSISNILDLDRLADVAVGMIIQALEIDKGFLFLVDSEIGENGQKLYRMSGARGVGAPPEPGGVLDGESPIVHYFLGEQAPLLQYDIDFAPDFLNAPLAERRWFSSLVLDVYVPIFSKGEWIGLLAFGPKPASRYTTEDLNMLETFASQTAVGLENARLVENLKKLNAQVREAYTSLDLANHDLAKLESTKSNFISIASHELRTPLTVARGYVEMLLEDQSLPAHLRELVEGVHKSILRQHEIMDSMFEIAKLDARSADLETQDVFLTEVIRNVALELSKPAGERCQEILLDLPELPPIRADSDAMRKLFRHLMMNAIKFTPNNGQIQVTGGQIMSNNRDLPEGGVEIVVSDTGVGVDEDLQKIIFTRFYQPGELLNRHSTGKTKFKGSGMGLGLALSKAIVDAHGGRIWVESPGYDDEKYPGSAFHVVLPLRSQGESNTVPMGSPLKMRLA